MERAVLTVEETANLLRLDRNSTYKAIHEGVIPHRRIGRRIVVPLARLLEWLNGGGVR